MKKLIVFDLDGTLAESKASLDAEMATLLSKLFGIVKVAIISGGNWPQFEKQVLSNLPHDERLKNLSLLPTCGTKFYQYETDWKKLYSEDFTAEEKEKIIRSLQQASDDSGFKLEKSLGRSDRRPGKPDHVLRTRAAGTDRRKEEMGPGFHQAEEDERAPRPSSSPSFRCAWVERHPWISPSRASTKLTGLGNSETRLALAFDEMIFVGDALFPGGNDYPAKEAGALSIQVRDPNETKRVIETIIACLDGVNSQTLRRPPMSGFQLQRLGLLMEPEPGNPHEVEGTLNPAAVRGPDGRLYLFPRLVAKGNYSRIGIARVKFNEAGDPCGVERLGIALEPEADYERLPDGGGGCEDPRVTFVEPLGHYVMTYTALSPVGPRIALAMSEDLFHWERIGLATFEPYRGIDFVHVDNKDASIFPVAIPNHAGKMQLALLHRPLFPGTRPEETACEASAGGWIAIMKASGFPTARCRRRISNRIAPVCSIRITGWRRPVSPWEQLKIGGGTPPVLTRHGWLILYHGVSKSAEPDKDGRELCYSAGSHGALGGASAEDPLSLAGAGVDTGVAGRTSGDDRERRLPDRHRPARRSRHARPFRRLLRDGGQPDRRGPP